MDDFDFIDTYQSARSGWSILWNVLTFLVFIAVIAVAGVFLLLFLNPNAGFNPFPPPTLPAVMEWPTATPTARLILPATWTPSPTSEPTLTHTPRPTATLPPSATPFTVVVPSITPAATPIPGGAPFAMAQGSPVAISSLAFHPDAGCEWMSVAGQVVDMSDAPISTGILIQLHGTLGGRSLNLTSLTGVAPQFGPSGYEIILADRPIASKGSLYLQMFDQAGIQLSDKVYFDTYAECNRNLIIIKFEQVR